MSSPKTRRVTLSGLLIAAGVLAVFATLTGFAARLWWLFELASHFRVQYALALGFGTLALLAWRRYRWAVVFAVFALVNAATLAPRLLTEVKAGVNANHPAFRALLANVHSNNRDHDRIRRMLVEVNPDFIVLLEVTPWLIAQLTDLANRYPYRIVEPREDNFGMAVYSRLPLLNAVVIQIGPAGLPLIRADLESGGHRFTLFGAHPPPPIGANMAQDRNDQLTDLARLVQEARQPTLLLGDLNLSPWSPYFTQLLADAGLQDSAARRGIQASWPAFWLPLRIPIDHALYSAGIQIRHRELGPAIGSDHYPVIVDFQVSGP